MIKHLILFLFIVATPFFENIPDSKRASDARAAVWPRLQNQLKLQGFNSKYRVYVRIIKQIDLLEVWVKKGDKYEMFKRYDICYYSGGLGTKTKDRDGKSPEGFYTISKKQLNPVSNYHLSINIGYPNKLEQQKGYTGNAIMVHGSCASIGCYAMTNPYIEEIYTMVYKALEAGQDKVRLDIFPFRMDEQHMKSFATSPNIPFWKTMKPGYEAFEKNHISPEFDVVNKEYKFKN